PGGQQNDLGGEWSTGVIYPGRYSWVMAISGALEDDAFADAPPEGGGGNPPGGCGEGDMCGVPDWCPAGSRYGPQIELAAPFWALEYGARRHVQHAVRHIDVSRTCQRCSRTCLVKKPFIDGGADSSASQGYGRAIFASHTIRLRPDR